MAAKKSKPLIFDNDAVTPLAIQFKQNQDLVTYKKVCDGSHNLMDAIIRGGKFHMQAPFEDIKNHLFLQVENWLAKWAPEKGKLYTYFSTCIKHACLSYVTKENLLRTRFVYSGDLPMLDALSGAHIQPTFTHELRQSLGDALKDIEIRWREPVIKEVIRYMVECIVQNRADRRKEILNTVVMGYPITMDTAKFLLDWATGAVRACLLQKYDQPLGEIDIIRASEKFDRMADIVALVGIKPAKLLMATFSGQTIRFPSQTQLRRHTVYKRVYESLNEDPSPDQVTALAREHRTTPDKIEEYYEKLHQNIHDGLLDDVPLFEGEEADEATEAAFHG